MPLTKVVHQGGYLLVYNPEDVAKMDVQTPRDVLDAGVTESGAALHELGTARLNLNITFKPGKSAYWIKEN